MNEAVTPRFEVLRHEPIFKGHIFEVERRSVSFGSTQFDREIVHHPGAVAVVATTDEGKIIFIEQYRASVDRLLLEIPAGTKDQVGESLERTAERELLEETGYKASSFELLGEYLNSPGYSDQVTAVFWATGLALHERSPQGVEESVSTLKELSLTESLEAMRTGLLSDAMSCLAVLHLVRRHAL